jgi:hypothetical protein
VGALPVGDGDDHRFDGTLVRLLQEASGAENLVVGVRRHHDETASGSRAQRWQTLQSSGAEPRALVGPGVPVVDD